MSGQKPTKETCAAPLPPSLLAELAKHDTPTICNSLEIMDPSRRGFGYTKGSFVVGLPALPPVVGYARTAEIRAASPFDPAEKLAIAMEMYEYVQSGAQPSIVAMQDLDYESGVGANWGEIHTQLFHRLGALGTVTNGAIRDLHANHPGYQLLGSRVSPSHRHVRVVSIAREVDVCGMCVKDGDIIHMDQHGAVCFPPAMAHGLPEAIAVMVGRERLLLDVINSENFSLDAVRGAMLKGRDIQLK